MPGDGGGRVRVVILHYNQPEMTGGSDPYVGKQTYSPLDIVVVDNTSTQKILEPEENYSPRM